MKIQKLSSQFTLLKNSANNEALHAPPVFNRPVKAPRTTTDAADSRVTTSNKSRVQRQGKHRGTQLVSKDSAPALPSDTPAPMIQANQQAGFVPTNQNNGKWHDVATSVHASASEFIGFVARAPGQFARNHRLAFESAGEYTLGAVNAGATVVAPSVMASVLGSEMVVSGIEWYRGNVFPPVERDNALTAAQGIIFGLTGGALGGAFIIQLDNHGLANVNRRIENAVENVAENANAAGLINPTAARFFLQE